MRRRPKLSPEAAARLKADLDAFEASVPPEYRSRHYNRRGEPITMFEWATAYEGNDRHVGLTTVGPFRVSTVWLGLDHSFGNGPPLIFETMVFAEARGQDHYCARYATLAEAVKGHRATVRQFRARLKQPDA